MHRGKMYSHLFNHSLSIWVNTSVLMFLAARGVSCVCVFAEPTSVAAETVMVERVVGSAVAVARAKSEVKATAYCMAAVWGFLPSMLASLFKFRGGLLYKFLGLVL